MKEKKPAKKTLIAILGLMIVMVSAAFLYSSCSRNKGCNVLLITMDTTRADHIASYGFKGIQTPNIDSIGREGVLFKRAYSHLPMTLPAHTSMLSGTYPYYHSVIDNGEYRVPNELTMLPEVLKQNGFTTAAFISAAVLKKTFNINKGFDHWDEEGLKVEPGLHALLAERKGNLTTDAALAWLEQNHRKRWFVWVHYYDPHFTYNPPPPYNQIYASGLYSGEIAFMDSQIKRLLDFLKEHRLKDRTIVIAIADHGESLGQHLEETHSIFIYQSTQHIPFLIRVPGLQKPGREILKVVGQVDLMPTILDFLNLPAPKEVQGRSLKKLITGEEKDGDAGETFMESHFPFLHFGWSDLFGLQSADYHYIQAPKPELYDIAKDADENENIIAGNPKLAKEFNYKIEAYKKASKSKFAEEVNKGVELDDITRRQLEALGYAAGAGKIDPERARKKNPKDFADLVKILTSMQSLRISGNFDLLMAQADTVLKRDPDNTQAVKMKADAFFGMGKYKEGIDFLKKAIARSGDNPEYYYHIGLNSVRLEDLPTAQSAFEATVKLDPRKETARYYLARIYLSQAHVKDALKVLDDGKMRDSGLGHLFMAFYYSGIPGMTSNADREFETALKELPENALARREYGQYMLHSGRPGRALELFEEAEKLDPSFKVDRAMQGWKQEANSILGK